MKILLINPPCRESLPPSHFPLGLGYIAAVLKKNGHEVSVLDIDAYRYNSERVIEELHKADFQIAATGGMITVYKYAKWLAEECKKLHPEAFFVIGGAMATSAPEIVMEKTKADAIVLGEGEMTMAELASALEKGTSLAEVKGIWFRENGRIVKNQPRELIKNIDELPYPAWDLFPMDIYLRYMHIEKTPQGWKSMDISSVRGCPFNCSFCYNVFGEGTTRSRSPDSVIAEIKLLKEKFGIRAVSIGDNMFITNRQRVLEFCEKMIQQKVGIVWGANARVDVVDFELLCKMKEAGCVWIAYGLESGSQKMLDAMNKHTNTEKIHKAIEATKKAGIHPFGSFMVGMPGENAETIRETVEFIKAIDIFVPCIFIANPYPGSALYAQAKQKGLIKDEEKFIEQCGEALNLTVNLTDMEDSELLKLRDSAMKEVISHYRKKHKMEAIKMDLQKIGSSIAKFGIAGTAKKALGRVRRALEARGTKSRGNGKWKQA